MANLEVQLDEWPNLDLPHEEIKATLHYLAHKSKKAVTFRWFTENEGYSDQSVSVRIMVHDGLAATYNVKVITLNGAVHTLSSDQKGTALANLQQGWKRIEDESGTLIGLVDHNRIIVPIEITATENDAAKTVLAYVIEKAVDLLDFDVAGILREKEAAFAKEFSAAFQNNAKTRLQVRQEEFNRRKREAEEAYDTLMDFERERPLFDQELAFLTGLTEKPCDKIARQQARALLQVQSGGQYTHVTFDGEGVLHATTSAIIIEHDDYEFPMGRYEVVIPADGDVRINALDEHPRADRPHPHVANDNRPCLGNISGDLVKLIGRMRYGEALQMLHSFLSSYNPENPYEKIGHFDPEGRYDDEEDDPCESCDERCTPYCIFNCGSNADMFSCEDCCEYRGEYCYTDCEHNEDYDRFHPCDGCRSKGTEECYLECKYNREWQLQDPCGGCDEEDCTDESCTFHERKEKLNHATTRG